MAAVQGLILLTSALIASGQRPFFAGSRPIGYPELLNKTTTTPSGLEDKFGEVTTQRLPIEAQGDRELVDRLSKLPLDKQPFWLINWQALEANREKPQTYPLKPSPFLEPNWQNTNSAPINNPVANPNTGFVNPGTGLANRNPGLVNPNPGFVNPNPSFINPNAGFVNPNPGFVNPNPGFVNPNPGFGNTNPGFLSPSTGFGNSNPSFVNPNQSFVNPNSGFSNANPSNANFPNVNPGFGNANPGFANANPSFGNANSGSTGNFNSGIGIQSPNLRGQDPIDTKNANSSVENRYGTQVNTASTAINNTAITNDNKIKKPVLSINDVIKNPVTAVAHPGLTQEVLSSRDLSQEENEFEDIEVKKFYKNH